MTNIIDKLNTAHGRPALPWTNTLLGDAATEITRLRAALTAIRDITGDTHRERPYTALSQIDQVAQKALA